MTWENRVYSGRENKLNILPFFICTRNSSRFLCLLCARNFDSQFSRSFPYPNKNDKESIDSTLFAKCLITSTRVYSRNIIEENGRIINNKNMQSKNIIRVFFFSFFFFVQEIRVQRLVQLVASFLEYDSIRKIIGIKIRNNKKYKRMKKVRILIDIWMILDLV